MLHLTLSVVLYLITFAFGFLLFDQVSARRRSLPIGATLVTLLWNSGLWLVSIWTGSDLLVAQGKLILELVVIVYLISRRFRQSGRLFSSIEPDSLPWWGSAVLGWCILMVYPLSSDNHALYWTATALSTNQIHFHSAQGSPFYISLIWFPAVLLENHLSIGNVAASLKVFTGVAAFWCLARMCRDHFPARGLWLPGLIFADMLTSFFFSYGVWWSGKETPMGMMALALFGYLVILPQERRQDWELGASAAIATGLAAVTIPYLAIWIGLGCLLRLFSGRELIYLVALGAASITPSFSSMLMLPYGYSLVGYVIFALVIFFAYQGYLRIPEPCHVLFSSRAGLITIMAIPTLVCAILLPYHYDHFPMYPLNGKTTFPHLIITTGFMLVGTAFGILGWLHATFDAVHKQRPGLTIHIAFPWWALAIVLVICRIPPEELPIPAQHLWDLAKDIPNYWLAWHYAFLVAFYANLVSEKALPRIMTRFPLLGRLFTPFLVVSLALYLFIDLVEVYFSEGRAPSKVGLVASSDPEYARVLDRIIEERENTASLLDGANPSIEVLGKDHDIWSQTNPKAWGLHNSGCQVYSRQSLEPGSPTFEMGRRTIAILVAASMVESFEASSRELSEAYTLESGAKLYVRSMENLPDTPK